MPVKPTPKILGFEAPTAIHDIVQRTMNTCLKHLFETKHLYQSVTLVPDGVVDFIKRQHELRKSEIRRAGPNSGNFAGVMLEAVMATPEVKAVSLFHNPWKFCFGSASPEMEGSALVDYMFDKVSHCEPPLFALPTIAIPCNHCDGVRPPHNPGFLGSQGEYLNQTHRANNKEMQLFVFPFQCQNCKGEPLLFMVRRDGLKLTIVGRSQFENVQVPRSVPPGVAKFYRGAIVGFQTGHPLAGLFYLRTMTEQYMRSVVKPDKRLTGDQLADEYGKTLPSDFSGRYPSLRRIYDELSQAIHEAREDLELFERAIGDLENHFEAKPFFMVKPKRTKGA